MSRLAEFLAPELAVPTYFIVFVTGLVLSIVGAMVRIPLIPFAIGMVALGLSTPFWAARLVRWLGRTDNAFHRLRAILQSWIV